MKDRGFSDRRLRGPNYRRRLRVAGPVISGPRSRLRLGAEVGLADVLINTSGGHVNIGNYVFFGHNVMLLTGTHEFRQIGADRQRIRQDTDRSITIEDGAWIASRAILIGPCKIGMNSVVACGCVVDFDVPADTLVRARHETVMESIRYLSQK
jgi:acetyltransferase-like isoleucine patch superfamily enzyme